MTKYPVTYYSESKRADLSLEDMPTPHIANAWRRLGGDSVDPLVGELTLRSCMWDELIERGCTYDAETGQWTFPEKAS